jgi:hypothetical protein
MTVLVILTYFVGEFPIFSAVETPKSHGRPAHVASSPPATHSPPFLLRRFEFGSKCNPGSVNAIQEGLNEEENSDNSQLRPASNF